MVKSIIKKTNSTFLYFSYGSNLSRLKIGFYNLKVDFISIARLDNYRLDFNGYSKFWGGPTATIVPTANAHVWGVVWRIDTNELQILEEQEDVDIENYYVKYVEVLTSYIGILTCRTYIQKVNLLPRSDNDNLPVERWPSLTYRNVIIFGAIEHHLPEYYIESLKKLKDNGEEGSFKMAYLLKLFTKNDACKCRLPRKCLPKKILNLRNMRYRMKSTE
ncbi:unnamed protein product [Parnassius mnemosyne]|uniref:gamma-glutamylcyclotransferase n=1 Tax=Parnassius mnemosyne TaxID=213953 RepID=A0AAV1M8K6_9NEOP